MTTDLGVECMVGLCLAAAIWWIARRRRTHTEGPKTRLDPLGLGELEPLSATDDKKDDLLVEDTSAQRNASGARPDNDLHLDSSPGPQQQQEQEHKLADEVDNASGQESDEEDESWDVGDEDDAAEPDLTDDEDDEREEAGDEDEEDDEETDEPRVVNTELVEVPLETLARVEALAAKMGVNMTESFMAMEEFLVLDAPPSLPDVLPSLETDRMRLEDHAVVPLSDSASADESSDDNETDNNDDLPVEQRNEEEKQERRESHDDDNREQVEKDAAPDAEAAFWAKCENADECNLCHTPFTFLTRRHHCRKCFASVCGGCSASSAPLPEFGGRMERVCDACLASLQQQKLADEETATTEEAHEQEAS